METKFNFKSAICTSREQSERLLALGLKKETADMMYEGMAEGERTCYLALAQKWLREAHNLHIEITYSPSCWTGKIYDLKEWDYIKGFTFFESFEDALHTLIKESVKILNEK